MAKRLSKENENLKKFVQDQLGYMIQEAKLISDATARRAIATPKTFLSKEENK